MGQAGVTLCNAALRFREPRAGATVAGIEQSKKREAESERSEILNASPIFNHQSKSESFKSKANLRWLE